MSWDRHDVTALSYEEAARAARIDGEAWTSSDAMAVLVDQMLESGEASDEAIASTLKQTQAHGRWLAGDVAYYREVVARLAILSRLPSVVGHRAAHRPALIASERESTQISLQRAMLSPRAPWLPGSRSDSLLWRSGAISVPLRSRFLLRILGVWPDYFFRVYLRADHGPYDFVIDRGDLVEVYGRLESPRLLRAP